MARQRMIDQSTHIEENILLCRNLFIYLFCFLCVHRQTEIFVCCVEKLSWIRIKFGGKYFSIRGLRHHRFDIIRPEEWEGRKRKWKWKKEIVKWMKNRKLWEQRDQKKKKWVKTFHFCSIDETKFASGHFQFILKFVHFALMHDNPRIQIE